MADIDARLDRLTERHEALTQTVEIIAGMQRENEKKISEITAAIAKHENFIDRLTNAVAQLVEIVRRHEERLENLES
jgi:prefoldin subunit 5